MKSAATAGDVSWFGPSQMESEWGDLPPPDTRSSPDAQFFFREVRRMAQGGEGAFQRLFRAFLAARVALAMVLVAAQLLARYLGAYAPQDGMLVCVVYAVAVSLIWLWPGLSRQVTAKRLARPNTAVWWLSMGMDLLVFGLLNALDTSAGVSYSALFILPVMMAGVLTPRVLAMATAAVSALVLLGLAGWQLWLGLDGGLRITHAGLAGSGFFVVGLLASELGSRLAREERSARGSLEFARQQAQLNRLVLDEMQEGVLVVDRRGRVRAANPAACALLGDVRPARAAPFQLRSTVAWQALVDAVDAAFMRADWPEAGRDVGLSFESGMQRSLRVRMRFTRQREPHADEDLCVLLIEDNRQVQARNRQEKLAAMGRVSAGIAHEIRNPLAAIDQANALLAEDAQDANTQALTRMVANNVQRLKRIVDDVMEVAPGLVPEPAPLDVPAWVHEAVTDWARTNQLPMDESGPLRLRVARLPCWARFEREHLRRVLINLLDNALRHGAGSPIELQLHVPNEHWVKLVVKNGGELISPEVERHLFEPFFSTRSRGSGLGLYICRELCERYAGRIEFVRSLHFNEFHIWLRRLPTPTFSAPL